MTRTVYLYWRRNPLIPSMNGSPSMFTASTPSVPAALYSSAIRWMTGISSRQGSQKIDQKTRRWARLVRSSPKTKVLPSRSLTVKSGAGSPTSRDLTPLITGMGVKPCSCARRGRRGRKHRAEHPAEHRGGDSESLAHRSSLGVA